jgi:hypothetical protein
MYALPDYVISSYLLLTTILLYIQSAGESSVSSGSVGDRSLSPVHSGSAADPGNHASDANVAAKMKKSKAKAPPPPPKANKEDTVERGSKESERLITNSKHIQCIRN